MADTEEPIREPVPFRLGVKGLRRAVRPHRRLLAILATLGVLSAIAASFVPYVTGRFFDALIALGRGEAPSAAGLPYWLVFLILWMLIRIVTDGTDWWSDRRRRWLETQVQLGVETEGFTHLLKLPVAFHTTEHMNEMAAKINAAAWRTTSILRTIVSVGPQILSIAVGITLAYTLNASLAQVLLAGVLGYALALLILLHGSSHMHAIAHKSWMHAWDEAASVTQQAVAVKQATAEGYEEHRIHDMTIKKAGTLWYKNEVLWSNISFWQRLAVSLTQLGIFAFSVHLITQGAITVGELVAVNGYALMFFGPLVALGNSWQIIQEGITSAGELEKVYEVPQEIYHPRNARSKSIAKGAVEFEHVSFRYEKGTENVLEDLHFTVSPGQSVAFVGESGVGKSSAIGLISAYYFPTEGAVRVGGYDTREWDLTALRARIAVVPQEVALFNDTIRANIRYGNFGAPDSAVERAAQQAHIHDFIIRQPKQYETLVGDRGIKLSVGQKQRIAIARAILRNPDILILDEPTSALDVETEKLITESLHRLMEGRTTFIVAHRLSTIRKADVIMVIKDGRIAEQGTHAELLAKKDGIYHRLHDLHVGLYE